MTFDIPELLSCKVCPHECGVDRYLERGFCRAGSKLKINLAQLHHGEEPVLSGTGGSGTIFFSHCNLRCVFCQNFSISHEGWGREYEITECAETMLRLQADGAHNINLVSPTHYTPHLVGSIKLAKDKGLQIPVVWNSNAYESLHSLKQLKGLIDIFLPDFKYTHSIYSEKYSGAKDYPRRALEAICEMHSQVGDLSINELDLATRGVMVRHLVLPNRIAGTREVLYQLRERFGNTLYLSLLAQYYPAGESKRFPELGRGITSDEYVEAVNTAQELGFEHVYIQELSSSSGWTPAFKNEPVPLSEAAEHFRGKETNV